MIKVFRRIRQSLLAQNKFSKYLIYAIGEIVLVVIGILIALSINNWNEQKKSDTFELKMLGEVYKSLSYDNYILKVILKERIKVVDSSINAILRMYETGNFDMEKFSNHTINLEIGYVFSTSSGPYETLKISGLDKVRNDTLRDKLIFHYDYDLPRRISFLEEYNSNSIKEKTNDLEDQIFDYKIITDNKEKTLKVSKYKFEDPNHPLFLKYLNLKIRSIESGKRNFTGYINDSNKLIDLLLNEFKRRNHKKPRYIIL